MKVKVIFITLS